MKPLSQSLADATRIIGALVPRGCDSLTFQDGPATNGDDLSVIPARWPGGIGETPAFEGAA